MENKLYKELVTLELRYKDDPGFNKRGFGEHVKEQITVGVYDSYDDACVEGNRVLETLEGMFKLNPVSKIKERFGHHPYFKEVRLITETGYLQTPFEFYLKIVKLEGGDVLLAINEAVDATIRYENFKDRVRMGED